MLRVLILLIGLCLVAGCASLPNPRERRAIADDLAARHGWTAHNIATQTFALVAYTPQSFEPAETLTVYLEGDGFAWVTGTQPSLDPTPRNPLGLRLALAQRSGNVAYLARPCQYVDAERTVCSQRYWTTHRFAPEVIAASERAIDHLKQHFGARKIVLVGYSGGAAVAALLASRRTDVTRLVTVAGNLDHLAWSRHHRISALEGSLNPADVAGQLARLPQTHFVGGLDAVVPLALAQSWPVEFLANDGSNLHVVPEFDHVCCWTERWLAIYQRDVPGRE
jgi:dienelactone hydrolase